MSNAPPTGQQTSTGTTAPAYPYGPYHLPTLGIYPHPQTPGAYSYQPPAGYATGVTGYGAWPYTYSYMPQTQPSAYTRPQQTTPLAGSSTAYTPATAQRSTFTSYTPSYARESAGTTGGATGRGPRKQANFKGQFSKECERRVKLVQCVSC
jgi:transcription initiation factor TFIID subunit 13